MFCIFELMYPQIMKKAILHLVLLLGFYAIPATGQVITTIAGTGTAGFSGDGGPATAATIHSTWDLITDASGSVFSLHYTDHRIRRIDPTGVITTYAGTGTAGFSGDGGLATAAQFNTPEGMAIDATGNIYVADYGNYRIRKIAASGIITTIAGDGFSGHSGDGGPASAARITPVAAVSVGPDGTIYFVAENSVRSIDPTGIIHTVAGALSPGFSGDGGPATAARFSAIQGMDVDSAGNIYIADRFNYRIRKVSATTGIVTTICGTGSAITAGDGGPASAASIDRVHRITCDRSGNIYLACDDARIRMINAAGNINTIAGTGILGFSGDGGPATAAQLANPYAITTDCKGTIYYGETITSYCRIRAITVPQFAPVYAEGSVATVQMCMGTVKNIDTLLALSDANSGQDLSWGILLPAAHGTVTGGSTLLTTGGTLQPTGFSYTPTPGYSGTDSFSVIATDCGNLSDTIKVRVLVDTIAFAGSISGADTVCVGFATTCVAGRNGGTWSSSNTAIATVGTSGIVNGIATGTATITYRITNTCGTHATYKNMTVMPATACAVSTANQAPTASTVQLYPNPCKGLFSLLLPGNQPAHITISDVAGRIIDETDGSGTIIHNIAAPPGIYFVHIRAQEYSITRKLIISQ